MTGRVALATFATAAMTLVGTAPVGSMVARAAGSCSDNHTLAYTSIHAGKLSIVTSTTCRVTPDRRVYTIASGHNAISSVQVSPTGGRIAATVALHTSSENPTFELIVMDLDGGHRRTLTSLKNTENSFQDLNGFTWTADSKQIIYFRFRFSFNSFTASYGLRVVNTTGAPKSRPLAGGKHLQEPAASPDGTRLAVFRYDDTRRSVAARLLLMNLKTGKLSKPLLTSDKYAYGPAWSPDGSRIAYSQDTTAPDDDQERSDIDVLPVDGSSAPATIARGGADYLDLGPTWQTNQSIWFGQEQDPDATSDKNAGDLYSVNLRSATPVAAINRTSTGSATEAAPTFGRPDRSRPAAPAFRSVRVTGRKVVLTWTDHADGDFSHAVLTRDGKQIYSGIATSYTDHHVASGHHRYVLQTFDGAGNHSRKVGRTVRVT